MNAALECVRLYPKHAWPGKVAELRRGGAISGLAQPMSEMCLYRRPLAIENAVDAGIAQRTVGCELMLPQDPIQFRAQSLDGRAALLVEEMRAEFHCDAIQLLECVGQEQQLALGVQGAALHALPIPGRAVFGAPIE